jgi:predicted amidophosphoribosyltransferase
MRDVGEYRVAAAGDYRDGLRAALLAYKERNRRGLAVPLGGLLARAVRDLGPPPGPYVVVAVPSVRAAARVRGGDHIIRLADVVSGLLGVPLLHALSFRRSVRDSAGLDSENRSTNLSGAMCARAPDGDDRVVVLLDDIVTTGATLHEAARALTQAGWDVAGAAVVAATARRGRSPVRRAGRGPTATAEKW